MDSLRLSSISMFSVLTYIIDTTYELLGKYPFFINIGTYKSSCIGHKKALLKAALI